MRISCIALSAMVVLSGCSWIGRQADSVGEYMPVIGERCEHWQCMTEGGQKQSDANKRKKLMQEQGGAAGEAAAPGPEQQAKPKPMPDEWYGDEGEEQPAK